MIKDDFYKEIRNVRDILGHLHITDAYLEEFVKKTDIDTWECEIVDNIFKKLKSGDITNRKLLTVDSIIELYMSELKNLSMEKYSKGFFNDLKKAEACATRKEKVSFIVRFYRWTRTYVYKTPQELRFDSGYKSMDTFQKSIVDEYIKGREEVRNGL